jgi:phosphate acetyltransferase
VQLVREGKAEALMKGSLHTDELMGAWSSRETGCAPRGGSATAS